MLVMRSVELERYLNIDAFFFEDSYNTNPDEHNGQLLKISVQCVIQTAEPRLTLLHIEHVCSALPYEKKNFFSHQNLNEIGQDLIEILIEILNEVFSH